MYGRFDSLGMRHCWPLLWTLSCIFLAYRYAEYCTYMLRLELPNVHAHYYE